MVNTALFVKFSIFSIFRNFNEKFTLKTTNCVKTNTIVALRTERAITNNSKSHIFTQGCILNTVGFSISLLFTLTY